MVDGVKLKYGHYKRGRGMDHIVSGPFNTFHTWTTLYEGFTADGVVKTLYFSYMHALERSDGTTTDFKPATMMSYVVHVGKKPHKARTHKGEWQSFTEAMQAFEKL